MTHHIDTQVTVKRSYTMTKAKIRW